VGVASEGALVDAVATGAVVALGAVTSVRGASLGGDFMVRQPMSSGGKMAMAEVRAARE
jgi:CO dehydrogenase/acetyl-CoA synthase delta subunit